MTPFGRKSLRSMHYSHESKNPLFGLDSPTDMHLSSGRVRSYFYITPIILMNHTQRTIMKRVSHRMHSHSQLADCVTRKPDLDVRSIMNRIITHHC